MGSKTYLKSMAPFHKAERCCVAGAEHLTREPKRITGCCSLWRDRCWMCTKACRLPNAPNLSLVTVPVRNLQRTFVADVILFLRIQLVGNAGGEGNSSRQCSRIVQLNIPRFYWQDVWTKRQVTDNSPFRCLSAGEGPDHQPAASLVTRQHR